jgi:hypothetical protein
VVGLRLLHRSLQRCHLSLQQGSARRDWTWKLMKNWGTKSTDMNVSTYSAICTSETYSGLAVTREYYVMLRNTPFCKTLSEFTWKWPFSTHIRLVKWKQSFGALSKYTWENLTAIFYLLDLNVQTQHGGRQIIRSKLRFVTSLARPQYINNFAMHPTGKSKSWL